MAILLVCGLAAVARAPVEQVFDGIGLLSRMLNFWITAYMSPLAPGLPLRCPASLFIPCYTGPVYLH
jgi:hypothetical protein